jgi:hypothetical protein
MTCPAVEARNGSDNGKPNTRRKQFDIFRPVSVKPDGHRRQSANGCVRFQPRGKRTCRSLGTAVRQNGLARATVLPTSQSSLSIAVLLEQYHRSAISRGLRPRSIAHAEKDLRRVARETAAAPPLLVPAAMACGGTAPVRFIRLKSEVLPGVRKAIGGEVAEPMWKHVVDRASTRAFHRQP